MARLPFVAVSMLLVTGVLLAQGAPASLLPALRAAVDPALPFPPARADGTPERGGDEVVWGVRWAQDQALVEVLANPLNEANRRRALEAEAAIQKSAMQAQRRSQSDYEQALADFARTGRTSEIREISLRDDGVAGERYDAESQVTVSAEPVTGAWQTSVPTARPLEPAPAPPGAAAVVRVSGHVYLEDGPDGMPGSAHYCAEQAWVFVGTTAPAIASPSGTNAAALSAEPGSAGQAGVVVSIRGNAELVQQVLDRADWTALAVRSGG
ncbi:MAG: hypothetical protein R2712_17425 [Vicinamibacterales bacterium]